MSRRVLFKAVLYVSLFLLLIACLIYSGLRILESTVYSNMPANTEDMGSIPALAGFHMPEGNWAHALQ